MIAMLKRLGLSDRGAAAIELAFALPILIVLIYGIFQVGVAYQASAGMQHALGEGARYATLFPTPDNDQIKDRIKGKVFGVGIGAFDDPTVTDGTDADGTAFKDLGVTFKMTPNFLFFMGPQINLSRTKRVYSAGRIA